MMTVRLDLTQFVNLEIKLKCLDIEWFENGEKIIVIISYTSKESYFNTNIEVRLAVKIT